MLLVFEVFDSKARVIIILSNEIFFLLKVCIFKRIVTLKIERGGEAF